MTSADESILWTMLMYIAPTVALYLAGVVVASMFLTRYPRPAWLALTGCGLFILSSGSSFLGYYAMSPAATSEFDPQTVLTVINIVGIVLHYTGLTLIFTAVFVDRRPRMEPAALPEE